MGSRFRRDGNFFMYKTIWNNLLSKKHTFSGKCWWFHMYFNCFFQSEGQLSLISHVSPALAGQQLLVKSNYPSHSLYISILNVFLPHWHIQRTWSKVYSLIHTSPSHFQMKAISPKVGLQVSCLKALSYNAFVSCLLSMRLL